ncbi:MAG: HAD family phosphatase [Clostridia bacterium]|nr:HAD family phosphatase [Clostridia bacterium]
MIKAVVFDMDGVIIDSEPIHIEIDVQVMRDLGKEPAPSEIYEFIGVRNEEMWATLIERHSIPETVEQLLARQKVYKQKRYFDEPLEPIPGIPELVRSIKESGLKIALATSSPKYFAEHVLKSVGIYSYFDALMTGDDISKSKPDPEIYIKAAKALDVEPGECVAIEDACLGIKSAKGAGLNCIAFQNPNSGNQDTTQADYVVSSIIEIDVNLIRKVGK